MISHSPRAIRVAWAGIIAGALALACGREPTGLRTPDGEIAVAGGIAFQVAFPGEFTAWQVANQTAGSGGVLFERVRIVLLHADGTVAVDTTVRWPAGVTELPLTLSIPLPPATTSAGVPLTLNLAYQNAAGQTVFTGGPATVSAVPVIPGSPAPAPASVTIPLVYTGTGASATRVVISPKAVSAPMRGAFAFSAQALDASGAVIPNTPIVFSIVDGALATLNAATGGGAASLARGSTTIRASLLNGVTDAATLTVTPVAGSAAMVSGSEQKAKVYQPLTKPVVVRVLALDGLPIAGTTVTFAAAAGGTMTPATATTGADGTAQATWKLGGTVGAQSATATVVGAGAVTFAATGEQSDPVKLAVASEPPESMLAGASFGFSVRAVDEFGEPTPGFTGVVRISAAGGLNGTTTATAVEGVATFSGLSLQTAGSFALTATTESLSPATTQSVIVNAGPAVRLAFDAYPSGSAAGAPLSTAIVVARDAFGNIAKGFSGPVTLGVASASGSFAEAPAGIEPAGAVTANLVTGTMTTSAVEGVARFGDLRITSTGAFSLSASSPGLTGASGTPIQVRAADPAVISLVSGGGQATLAGTTLAQSIVVRVVDSFGNPTPSVAVTFAPEAGAGRVGTTIVSTGASGVASTTWTLGTEVRTQLLNVTAASAVPNPLVVRATATAPAAPATPTTLAMISGPAGGANIVSGAAIAPTIIVEARLANAERDLNYNGPVTIALSEGPAGAILAGTRTVNAVQGVATFGGVNIVRPGSAYRIRANAGLLAPDSTALFNVVHGPAHVVVADSGIAPTQTAFVNQRLSTPFVARVTDALGNPVPGHAVAWTVTAGGGFLTSATSTTDATGRVRATLILGAGPGNNIVLATAAGVEGSAQFLASAIASEAVSLRFTTTPVEETAGAAFTPGVTVTALTASGAVATSFSSPVTLSLATSGALLTASVEGTPTLNGSLTVTATGGVATFPGLTITRAANYSLTATSGPLSVTSGTFRVKAGRAKKVRIDDGHGQSNTVGKKLGKKFVVRVTDEWENPAQGVAVGWSNITGNGQLVEILATTDATGRSSAALNLANGAGKHRVSAGVDGADDAPAVFEATAIAGKAKKLVMVGGPAGGSRHKAGAGFAPPIKVEARDEFENVDSAFVGAVSLSLLLNPGGDTAVAGAKSVNASGGVATFGGAHLRKTGNGFKLRISGADVAADSTGLLSIDPGPTKRLFADDGHGQSSTVGKALGKRLVLRATDAYGNATPDAPVTWTNLSGGGELSGQTSTTDGTGRSSASLKLANKSGKHTVQASVPGTDDPPVVFEATAVAGAAKKLKVTAGPAGNVAAGSGQTIRVEALDSLDNVDLTYTGAMSLAFSQNPGADTAIAGMKATSAVAGVAVFSGSNVRKTGSGYKIRVNSGALTADETGTFNVTPGQANKIVIDSGNGQSGKKNQPLNKPFVVTIADDFNNVVPGSEVVWSVTSGSGTVSEVRSTADSKGKARVTLTLGGNNGKSKVRASVVGSGASVEFDAEAESGGGP